VIDILRREQAVYDAGVAQFERQLAECGIRRNGSKVLMDCMGGCTQPPRRAVPDRWRIPPALDHRLSLCPARVQVAVSVSAPALPGSHRTFYGPPSSAQFGRPAPVVHRLAPGARLEGDTEPALGGEAVGALLGFGGGRACVLFE